LSCIISPSSRRDPLPLPNERVPIPAYMVDRSDYGSGEVLSPQFVEPVPYVPASSDNYRPLKQFFAQNEGPAGQMPPNMDKMLRDAIPTGAAPRTRR
jgi:hypothetical protein